MMLPKTYNPSPVLWAHGLFNNFKNFALGIFLIFVATEPGIIWLGGIFIVFALLGFMMEVLMARGYFLVLEVSQEGMDYDTGFFMTFRFRGKK